MKLLITASLLMLSIAALQAQNANAEPAVAAVPAIAGGYFVVYPQAPIITIRFDGNSDDIAKVLAVSHAGTGLATTAQLSRALCGLHPLNHITTMSSTTPRGTRKAPRIRRTLNQGSG